MNKNIKKHYFLSTDSNLKIISFTRTGTEFRLEAGTALPLFTLKECLSPLYPNGLQGKGKGGGIARRATGAWGLAPLSPAFHSVPVKQGGVSKKVFSSYPLLRTFPWGKAPSNRTTFLPFLPKQSEGQRGCNKVAGKGLERSFLPLTPERGLAVPLHSVWVKRVKMRRTDKGGLPQANKASLCNTLKQGSKVILKSNNLVSFSVPLLKSFHKYKKPNFLDYNMWVDITTGRGFVVAPYPPKSPKPNRVRLEPPSPKSLFTYPFLPKLYPLYPRRGFRGFSAGEGVSRANPLSGVREIKLRSNPFGVRGPAPSKKGVKGLERIFIPFTSNPLGGITSLGDLVEGLPFLPLGQRGSSDPLEGIRTRFRFGGLGVSKKGVKGITLLLSANRSAFSSNNVLNQNHLSYYNYHLDTYHRSNQDTCLLDKPAVKEGDWVQSGDLLADSASSVGGELAIGHNIIVAYMPWEGYNYEDAILINQRLVYEDIYTSIHIERYEIETKETKQGPEQITRELPDISSNSISHLDKHGIARIGSWVEEGDILVGKVTPFDTKTYTANEKFIFELFNKKLSRAKDSSLRAPKGIKAHVINVNILNRQKLDEANVFSLKAKGLRGKAPIQAKPAAGGLGVTKIHPLPSQVIAPSLRTVGKGLVIPAFHSVQVKRGGIRFLTAPLGFRGEGGKLQVGKSITVSNKTKTKKGKKVLRPSNVHIYLAEKRKIQVGDKMAGRHGNKGIVSRILPRQDMPFLPDGTPVDIVLNPLGVPSRMNVGQIYECLLGLAGRFLGEHYKIPPFDEIYGAEASRSFVFAKLYEARKKTGLEWLFDPNNPGKIRLFDGRTSDPFDQTVTVGIAYILKLVHMVDDKLHFRSTGPYSLVTQQPLRGRSKQGGQRLGEMEVWAIEGYGAAFVLSEMLTIKSDNMSGRQTLWVNLINNKEISLGTPESFKVLVCELQALCLDIGLFRQNPVKLDSGLSSSTINKNIEIDSLLHLA